MEQTDVPVGENSGQLVEEEHVSGEADVVDAYAVDAAGRGVFEPTVAELFGEEEPGGA